MILFLLKLIVAHILGDFLFQPEKWVKDKELKMAKSPYMYYHILVHAILLAGVLMLNLDYWLGYLTIVVSHFIFDLLKVIFKKRFSARLLFVVDQLAHIVVILLVTNVYFPLNAFDVAGVTMVSLLKYVIVGLLLTSVSSVIMKVFMSKWVADVASQQSLKSAGSYIGLLERLLVFVFVINGRWEGVGFLLAAKSIFRFGDLSNAKDRKLTEYVLIGSLLSFTIAVIISLFYLFLSLHT